MLRLACFLALAMLASCVPAWPPSAERGIGGTGAPLDIAERGIGGTGRPGGPAGTGIVGVITGFGSIFVDGFEVQFSSATPVQIDGTPASTAALRVGQVVAIAAAGPPTALEAQNLAIRHEVAGPVESISQGGTRAEIAGQSIVLGSSLEGASLLRRGAWVAVSGLRRPDGSIAATRIGPSPAGIVRVHGRLTAGPGGLRIGSLPVRPQPGVQARAGDYVALSGRYQAGQLLAASIAPDRLATNPFAHFGPHVGRVFVESYVSAEDGLLRTPGGLRVHEAAPFGAGTPSPRWSVITLERTANGGARATGLRFLERPVLPPPAAPHGAVPGFHQGSIEHPRRAAGQPYGADRLPGQYQGTHSMPRDDNSARRKQNVHCTRSEGCAREGQPDRAP